METEIIKKREKVSAILLSARIQKGYSQEKLGELVGFRQNTIARIEGCKFSPNADQLYALCQALGLEITIDGEVI